MNILMMTNTYKPLLGGLEKSIESFTKEFRAAGHNVVIVAPQYPRARKEKDVIRLPAMQNFNGSDFSVQLPIPTILAEALGNFKPDIIHAHHPFFIGDTALRVASNFNKPLVFTHHTLYEENVHYVPGNEDAMKRFVVELSTGYANLADRVFAPSESVMQLMRARGVETPIDVVPTGIYVEQFARGAGATFRKKRGIPSDAFVVGHLGRLAPEKNLNFVARAVASFLKNHPDAHFLVAGKGPSEEEIKQVCQKEGVEARLYLVGALKGKELVNGYHAMNVFAFASQSETQGLVLTEAMAAGIPVVGVDASGVREVVKDGINGRLLPKENIDDFVAAIETIYQQSPKQKEDMKTACRETANLFSMKEMSKKVLEIYTSLMIEGFARRSPEESAWSKTMRLISAQWELVKNLTKATGAMIGVTDRVGSLLLSPKAVKDETVQLPQVDRELEAHFSK